MVEVLFDLFAQKSVKINIHVGTLIRTFYVRLKPYRKNNSDHCIKTLQSTVQSWLLYITHVPGDQT